MKGYAMFIIVRRARRAMNAMLPDWMIAVFGVCLLIPGPWDEAALAVFSLVLCATQPIRARRAASAWRGGKSHRRAES